MIRDDEKLRVKIAEMLTEFCVEASVLSAVLGVLDSAIERRGFPGLRVVAFSFLFGMLFFVLGTGIQASRRIQDLGHEGIRTGQSLSAAEDTGGAP